MIFGILLGQSFGDIKNSTIKIMPQGWLRYGQHGARCQRLRPRPEKACHASWNSQVHGATKGNTILRKIGMNPTESSQILEVNGKKDVNRF